MPIINQCEECDSTDILMSGAVMKWNFENHEWVYFDGGSAIYMCQDKGHENLDVVEIEVKE